MTASNVCCRLLVWLDVPFSAFGELIQVQCMYKYAGSFARMTCVVEMIHVAFAYSQ